MISIITPTYNRGELLHNCYKSLVNQTCKDFEWIIIDDGSIDKTKVIVDTWIAEKKIKIKYLYQNNQGKHIAHNCGVLKSDGEWIFCLDSDDILAERAIEKITKCIKNNVENSNLGGIIALKAFSDGKITGTEFPSFIKEASFFALYNKYNFKGDALGVFKKSILAEYLFPKFKEEKFVTEALIYNRISKNHKMFLLNEVVYYCEYLEDGYTKNTKNLIRNNPIGFMVYNKELLTFHSNLKIKAKATINYISLSIFTNNYREIIKQKKIYLFLLTPIGYLWYLIRYRKDRET